MEAKTFHPFDNDDSAIGILRSLRDVSPAHYTLKMESFSLFLNSKIENYESGVFEAGGYKWKLSLYPKGNMKRNVNGHISLYLAIADTKTLPLGWEVNVNFKLFVFDHIRDKYLAIQDAEGEIKRFHRMKTEWGFDQLLPLDTFTDPSNGYLLDDCCVFGVEVFVIKYNGKGECASMMKDPVKNTFTWNISKFSAIDKDFLFSEEFVVGGHKWKLWFYPKGKANAKWKSASLFLVLADSETLPSERKLYAEYKLRIKDQVKGNHFEKEGILKSLRDVSPAHYTLKMESFSLFLNSRIENYESSVFEAGGYKWKLSLYPKGNMKRDVNGHISLYLAIADTKTLPLGCRDFEGEIKRFHRMKTEWGFDKLLSLDSFTDASNGYLLGDCCVFGAEVFVTNYYGKGESVSMMKDAVNNGYVWKISKFSAMDKEFLITWTITNFSANEKEILLSEKVVFGENQWLLCVVRKGYGNAKEKMLSLYLAVSGWETLPSARKLSAEFKLRIRDQLNGNHFESEVLTNSYSSLNRLEGCPEFLALNDLNDASKGFMLNDAINEVMESNLHKEVEHFTNRGGQVANVDQEVAVNGAAGGEEDEVGSVAEQGEDEDVAKIDEVSSKGTHTVERVLDDVAKIDEVSRKGTHTVERVLAAADGGHLFMSGVAEKEAERALGNERELQATCSRVLENQRVEDQVCTSDFMNTSIGLDCGRPNINLEVVLHGAQVQPVINGPRWEVNSSLSDCIAQSQYKAAGEDAANKDNHVKGGPSQKGNSGSKRKSDLKRKGVDQSKEKMEQGGHPKQKGLLFSSSLRSGVILRAAAAATSLSASQRSSSQRRSKLLKEARATIEVSVTNSWKVEAAV
ncbi:Ubiquitin carboxyl-terminal hydrolase 12 [Camellia lanceoleosa]|uniref:Ubiquitin carboxyl-terminal hydrolase 12 n=1 Tax=Camellia lanceoleosa TaxID=1840588 RepID=A0ACC0IIB2_9ERIC|nr:Ubiquitin carboxyl-terminal hydrolase 12 [Camellia lanceoleosa]